MTGVCACRIVARTIHATRKRSAVRLRGRMTRCVLVLLHRDVVPEAVKALVATKERREDRRVREENVSGSLAARRHPQEHVELAVPRLGVWMRVRHVDGLPSENADRVRILGRHCVVRQVRMEVETLDALEPSARIEILRLDERLKLRRSLDRCRMKFPTDSRLARRVLS